MHPAVRAGLKKATLNALGIHRIMFAVDNINNVFARLGRHSAKLIDELVQYEDMYLLCYIREPEGIIIGRVEQLGKNR